jgi:hypothetical protein
MFSRIGTEVMKFKIDIVIKEIKYNLEKDFNVFLKL